MCLCFMRTKGHVRACIALGEMPLILGAQKCNTTAQVCSTQNRMILTQKEFFPPKLFDDAF